MINRLSTLFLVGLLVLVGCANPASSSSSSSPDGTIDHPYSLAADGGWHNGSIEASYNYVFYKVKATPGLTYRVSWNDTYDGSGSKTADIFVDAYNESFTSYLWGRDNGYTDPYSVTVPAGDHSFNLVISCEYESGTFALSVTPVNGLTVEVE